MGLRRGQPAQADAAPPSVLDATWSDAGQRQAALRVAERTSVDLVALHCHGRAMCRGLPEHPHPGASYGIIAPLVHGVTVVVDDGDYDARRWYRILGEQQVTVWSSRVQAFCVYRAGC